MTLIVTDNHLQAYTVWLESQKYQINTIRNYLLDLKNFLSSSNNSLTSSTISEYIARDTGQNNHSRHLASISKFCQFATDQQLTSKNLFNQAKKRAENPLATYDLSLLLTQFAQKLSKENKSPATIKNYLGDIRQYINFCESQLF